MSRNQRNKKTVEAKIKLVIIAHLNKTIPQLIFE